MLPGKQWTALQAWLLLYFWAGDIRAEKVFHPWDVQSLSAAPGSRVVARGLPAALADQLPFITAEMSLAKANTPRHADKLRELAAAGCHERTGERSGVTVFLACFCHLFLLLSCGQIVPLRLGADPTLATSKPWRTSADTAATKANPHSGFTGSAAPELVHPVCSTVPPKAAQPLPAPSLHWAGSLLGQSKLLSACSLSRRLSPVCSAWMRSLRASNQREFSPSEHWPVVFSPGRRKASSSQKRHSRAAPAAGGTLMSFYSARRWWSVWAWPCHDISALLPRQ